MNRIAIGFLNHPHTIREVIEYSILAERGGFESVWMADESFLRDIIPYLSCIALRTKNLKLATGVVNPFSRGPMLIAQTIATLDELSDGRMILGLGAGGSTVEKLGISYEKPLTRVKESVQIIRELLKGDEVTFKGITQKYSGVALGRSSPTWSVFGEFRPARRRVPIYLAAMGPKMLQLAGEMADGALLSTGCPVGGIDFVVENLKIGSKKSKRDYRLLDIAAYIPTCLNPSETEKSILKKLVLDFVSSSAGESYLQKSRKMDLEVLGGPDRKSSRIKSFPSTKITDDILHQFVAFGKKDECVKVIDNFRNAGVKLPIIFPIGKKVKEIVSLFSRRTAK